MLSLNPLRSFPSLLSRPVKQGENGQHKPSHQASRSTLPHGHWVQTRDALVSQNWWESLLASDPGFVRGSLILAIGSLTLFSFKPAQAELVFCNQSGEDISIATLRYESSNDGMTATGWFNMDDNECGTSISGDLDQDIYFYTESWSYSTTDTSACVDTQFAFETVWDGDHNNPYYKDLRMSNPRFDICENLGSNYRTVNFKKVPNSDYWDHCVVAFGPNGRYSSECWDD